MSEQSEIVRAVTQGICDQIVGRDPLEKTIVESFATKYPDLSDDELCERMRKAARSMGADLGDLITPEIVAKWRPAVPA